MHLFPSIIALDYIYKQHKQTFNLLLLNNYRII